MFSIDIARVVGGVRRLFRGRLDKLTAEIKLRPERTGRGHELMIEASSKHGSASEIQIFELTDRHGRVWMDLLPYTAHLRLRDRVPRPGEEVRVPVILPESSHTQGGCGFIIEVSWRDPSGGTRNQAYDLTRP